MLKWGKRETFISHALASESIGLEPIDALRWNVYFGPFFLGVLDLEVGLLI